MASKRCRPTCSTRSGRRSNCHWSRSSNDRLIGSGPTRSRPSQCRDVAAFTRRSGSVRDPLPAGRLSSRPAPRRRRRTRRPPPPRAPALGRCRRGRSRPATAGVPRPAVDSISARTRASSAASSARSLIEPRRPLGVGLVEQHPGVFEHRPLAGRAGRQQHRRRRGRLADAQRGDVAAPRTASCRRSPSSP